MTEPLSPARRRLVLIATILASSLGFIDGSVVSVAIPAIRSDLGASFSQIQWVANAYTLLLSALVLVGGAAGDRFGQARMFGAGIAVFSLTSIGCALAGSAEQLIAWRAVQGLGAAFMVPGSLALIARSYPADQRGKAIGLWSMASGIAAALGPILGGFLIDAGGAPAWRWIFWINPLPGLITLAFLYLARIPDDSKKRASLDIPGALLATFGLGALAFGLSQASEAGVNVVSVAAWLVAGTLALLTFLLWEARSPAPMLPLSLFRIRTFNGANLLTFFLYFALAGSLFFLPMTLIEALSLPEAHAGSVYLPFTVVMAVVARLSGGMTDRVGPRFPLTIGSLITGLSFLAVAAGAYFHAFALGVLPAMAVLGVGMGFVVAPLSTTVMTVADDSLAGTASGVNNGISRIAGLFAVAVLGIVAALVYRSGLDPVLVPGSYGEPAAALSKAARTARAEAMLRAFVAVSVLTAVLSFLSAAIAWQMLPAKAKAA